MTNKQVANIIAFSAIATIIFFLIQEHNRTQKENKVLRDALNSNNLISDHLRSRLLLLLSQHPDLDADIQRELEQIASLLGLQQETVAILKLAKIIENLLKQLYKDNNEFMSWIKSKKKRKPVFSDYLDYAHEKHIIPKEDYHMISILKLVRNEEAHEIGIEKDKTKLVGCFMAGISITLSLYTLVKQHYNQNL